jgi:hypothetical protein
MFHLTARVAWHDTRWNGTVCRRPSCNSFCAALDRIREERDDAREDALAGKRWSALVADDVPPCKAESGAFMNDAEWTRRFIHPYAGIKKAEATHGHLKPTLVKIPPYATFVVPFAWMLSDEQEAIDARLPMPLPPDDESPFKSPWVFGRARQEAILKLFSSRLTPERSLVFFYCKEDLRVLRRAPTLNPHSRSELSSGFMINSKVDLLIIGCLEKKVSTVVGAKRHDHVECIEQGVAGLFARQRRPQTVVGEQLTLQTSFLTRCVE